MASNSLYLDVGRLGDEADGHPVQRILGLGISKRSHVIWEALALQQALHLLHNERTRDSLGQPSEKGREVNRLRLALTPALSLASAPRPLWPVDLLTLQIGDRLKEAAVPLILRNLHWPGR